MCRWTIWLVLVCAVSPARAGELETQRLSHLGKLWGKVQYLHPKLAYADIDWDAAAVDAVPKVRKARTKQEYAEAVRSMLAVLGDDGAVVEIEGEDGVAPAPGAASLSWAGKDGKVLVATVSGDDYTVVFSGLANLASDLKQARAVVFDLRDAGDGAMFSMAYLLKDVQGSFTTEQLTLPTSRYRLSSGYTPQSMGSSGGYTTGFEYVAAETVEPADEKTAKRVVFIVGKDTALPAIAVALQETRQGAVVVEGADEYTLGDQRLEVDMGEGVIARFTGTEVVHRGMAPVLRADRNVAVRTPHADPAMKAALALANAKRLPRRAAKRGRALPAARWVRDRTYDDTPYPDEGHRLLALFRMWTIIDLFYPYDHLIEWDGALAEFVPRFLGAADARGYAEAVVELSTRVADSHTSVRGGEADAIRGAATVPILARFFEHKLVVEEVGSPAAKAGVEVGDVIVKVDGKPVRKALREAGRFVAASHRVGWGYYSARAMLRGPMGSEVTLTLRGADGKRRDVTLKRDRPYQGYREPDRSYRLIDEDTGYAHLGKLTKAEVAPMFEAFKSTKAIVFDLRNYPRGTAWSIAPRLNKKPGTTYAARFERCLVQPGVDESDTRMTFRQPIPESDEWKYDGAVVVLIDERAISQSEHTAMFFEAATDAVFVGTETAGANGDVTDLCLPGGMCMYFTGHDVRHADGRQLQRVGIEPHIRVRPTVADIRAGKDRVLDRALKYLRDGAR